MIRVLQVFGRMDRGGAEAMIMNLYRNIDRTKIQFDFVVHTTDRCAFDDEIEKLGGRIFNVPRFNGRNIMQYINTWSLLLDSHKEWKIIHGHVRSTASIYLSVAQRKGLFTISHSHNTATERGISGVSKKLLQFPLRFVADYYFACSKDAGEWLFGKKICNSDKFTILNNAIDADRFKYDEIRRQRIREELNVSNAVVVGNVSRFNPQKNHSFLIDIFNEIHSKNKDAVLMLVGDGEDREKIEKKVFNFKLDDYVKFLGVRTDVDAVMQAFDVLIFPSLFEGLPVSIIEAQAAGVPCLLSDTISSDCKITDCVSFLSLDSSNEKWAEVGLELAQRPHCHTTESIKEHNYDIKQNAKWITDFYECKNAAQEGRWR